MSETHETKGYRLPGISLTPREATTFLIQRASAPGLLTEGVNWQQFEHRIPGATAAGAFIDELKREQVTTPSGDPPHFFRAQAILRDVVRRDGRFNLIPPMIEPSMGGREWAVLVALVAGQVHQAAIAAGVPEVEGNINNSRPKVNYLEDLLIPTDEYRTPARTFDIISPPSYQRFQAYLQQQGALFGATDLKYVMQRLAEFGIGVTDKVEQHRMGSQVLAEIFVGRLRANSSPMLPYTH